MKDKVEWIKWRKWKKHLLLPFVCLALDMSYKDMEKYGMDPK